MTFLKIGELEEREMIPGAFGRFMHTDNLTVAHWRFTRGAELPEHSHPHEQVTQINEGEFEFTLDGETRILTAGDVAVVPPYAVHSGQAIEDCFIFDVFHPSRDDFK